MHALPNTTSATEYIQSKTMHATLPLQVVDRRLQLLACIAVSIVVCILPLRYLGWYHSDTLLVCLASLGVG